MHAGRRVGQIVGAFEAFTNVVRVEHGVFRGLAQAVGTIRLDVGEGADEHSEITIEGTHASYRLRSIIVEAQRTVWLGDDNGTRQERLQFILDRNRP